MTTPRKMPRNISFGIAVLILILSSSACTHRHHGGYDRRLHSLEQQVKTLQDEVRRLNARHGEKVNLPQQDEQTLRKQIERLKKRRAELLDDFTPAHPSIVEIDRHIDILQQRIQTIKPDSTKLSE